jgi:hypothetical protein
MSYPPAILTMAQNLIRELGNNSALHENRFYMLWNAILNYHFPITHDYGIAPQTSITGTGSKPEFLIVKVARDVESIVLIVELKKPSEDTDAGRENVKQELIDYIEERFSETTFPTIYAIAGIGLSWSAYKMDVSGSPNLELVFGWTGNVTAKTSYERMLQIVSGVDEMTGTTRG